MTGATVMAKMVLMPGVMYNDLKLVCDLCDGGGKLEGGITCGACVGCGWKLLTKDDYSHLVSNLSRPAPQQGWKEGVRAALDAIRDVNDRMSDPARDAIADSCEEVEALLDQQPTPLVTLSDDNLDESLAVKFGRNCND